MFENWRLEGMPFDKIVAKLKDYARSRRLDGEASKGKQAVDLSRVQNWADEELVDAEEGVEIHEDGSINGLNVKCYYCRKKGHSTTQCLKLKNLLGTG